MVAVVLPLKVSGTEAPVSAPEGEAGAMAAAPTTRGLAPYSLLSRMRTRRPPALSRTTWRIVWFSKLLLVAEGGVGAAPHTPIQPAGAARAGGAARAAAQARASRRGFLRALSMFLVGEGVDEKCV